MKKNIFAIGSVLIFAISFFYSTIIASAGTIGNPVPGLSTGHWRITAEYDRWDKDMDNNMDLESSRLFGKFSYGVQGNVEIFGRLGFSEFEVGTVDSSNDLAFGTGVKVGVFENNDIKVGVVGQLFLFQGDISGDDFNVTEIDIACGVSHNFTSYFLTYGGLSVSMVEFDYDNGGDIDEDTPFYVFGGFEYKINNNVDLGLEIRMFGESSISLLSNFNF